MRRSLAIGILLLSGCTAAHVSRPAVTKFGGNKDSAQFEFWRRVNAAPIACYDDVFHGLLLYLNEKDPATEYAGRVRVLKEQGMIPTGFDRPPDEAVSRGILAMAVTRILNIKGGMMMHLTGDNPRYSLLELQDMDLFPPSSGNQTFSGAAFVGIIGKMHDYQHGDTSNLPATKLTQNRAVRAVD